MDTQNSIQQFLEFSRRGQLAELNKLFNLKPDLLNAQLEAVFPNPYPKQLRHQQHLQGKTALIIAVQNEKKDIVIFLLDSDADLGIQDSMKMTALDYAKEQIHSAVGVEIMLLLHSAKMKREHELAIKTIMTERDAFQSQLRSKSAECAQLSSTNSTIKQELNKITAQMADILNDLDEKGLECTRLASLESELASQIAKFSAELESRRAEFADSSFFHLEVVKFLVVSCEAAVNASDASGLTALMLVSKYGLSDIVQFLLNSSSDPNLQSSTGRTALMEAAENNQQEALKLLVSGGANPNGQDNDGATPLMMASMQGHLGIVTWVLEQDVSIDARNLFKETALMLACRNNREEVSRLLLEKGADVRLQNYRGMSALMIASEKGWVGVSSQLLECNSNTQLEIRGLGGETALMLAAKQGRSDVVALLLQHGADGWARNSQGFTSKYLANLQNHFVVEDMLTSWERNNAQKIDHAIDGNMSIGKFLSGVNLNHLTEFFVDTLEMESVDEFKNLSSKRMNQLEKQLSSSELELLTSELEKILIYLQKFRNDEPA